jgi:hypothetical protein
MKHILFGFLFIALTINQSYGQRNSCITGLDSLAIFSLVKEKGLLFYNDGITKEQIASSPVYAPKLTFKENKCQWEVKSMKYESTRNGKCKQTNGCTKITTLTVTIDAIRKRIINKKKEIEIIPNYE